MFFLAVLHSFAVCGDRDLETPSDGNFHPIRSPFPPGFHWDGTDVYVFVQPPSFLDLWRCVNFFLTLSGENSPFSRRSAAPTTSVEFSALSPALPGQDVPLPRWDATVSCGLLWVWSFRSTRSHRSPHGQDTVLGLKLFLPSYKSSL